MAKHDELLEQGPRQAPEPETAEERSKKLGLKSAGGGVAAGGIALAKFGGLAKVFVWLFAWNSISNAWRLSAWFGIAVVAVAVAAFLIVRARQRPGRDATRSQPLEPLP
jgi:hypothetical protein